MPGLRVGSQSNIPGGKIAQWHISTLAEQLIQLTYNKLCLYPQQVNRTTETSERDGLSARSPAAKIMREYSEMLIEVDIAILF